MDEFSNQLTDSQAERLAILLEEMGEAQQAIGKILRHGYHSYNPTVIDAELNISALEKELGDVCYAIDLLCDSGDLNRQALEIRNYEKAEKIKPYLHYQKV